MFVFGLGRSKSDYDQSKRFIIRGTILSWLVFLIIASNKGCFSYARGFILISTREL